ncbi:MAG: glycosyltransferase [Desulfovibrio sp.]|jgi:glycosyltransferase involved in cell wall biosynthesis|nr:glycosyltransferase [Desulfovibrio sp.]
MRIFYHLSEYVSHRVSGLDFADCLRLLGHEVSHVPEDAAASDLAVLHDDPLNYAAAYGRCPVLRALPVAAFCVWESDILPRAYVEALRPVQAVWTPSHFSRAAFARWYPKTRVLPHVVRRVKTSREDMEFAAGALRAREKAFRFFSIIDSINPRKNISALLAAFASLRAVAARPVFLVLKQYRSSFDLSRVPGVICIDGELSAGRMAALHILCDAYVSAHHSEGWGLGLSQAMAYGKPVLATGWSGNMEFMDEENSFPVPYGLSRVSAEMCERIPLFTPDMTWADIDLDALVNIMKRVLEGRTPPRLSEKAAAIAVRFGPESAAGRLSELLRELGAV